jgi:hypothetical protein
MMRQLARTPLTFVTSLAISLALPQCSSSATPIPPPSATIVAAPAQTPSPAPSASPPLTDATRIGISPGSGFEDPFGTMSAIEQQAVVSRMKAVGVRWLRLDYYPQSSYDRQFIEDVLMEDFGATPAQFAAFGKQAVAALRPYGVHTYEILNEVNGYTPAISAAQYVPLLNAAYTAIKSADSSSTVLMSGLSTGTGNQEPSTYLKAMYAAGAKGHFDAANMHPYSFPDLPAPADPSQCESYNGFCHDLPAIRKVMEQNGDADKTIWITEFGCPTGTAAGQTAPCTDATLAQQLTQAYGRARAWGWIGSFFVFSWQDNAEDGDFGLYYADGSPKPDTLAAYEKIAAVAATGVANLRR